MDNFLINQIVRKFNNYLQESGLHDTEIVLKPKTTFYDTEILEAEIIEEDGEGGRKLSDEQIQEIAQGLQSGQISEEDIQLIQQLIDQSNQDTEESKFEQDLSNISNSIYRLNFYDRIQNLQEKLEKISNSHVGMNLEKFDHINTYLDILLTLVYSLDINILYQLYTSLELKALELIKEELGISDEPEERFQINLEITGEKDLLEDKYKSDIVIQKFIEAFSDQMEEKDHQEFEKDLSKLIDLGIYSPEQLEDFKAQAQAQLEQMQQQEQGEPDQDTQGEQQPEQGEPQEQAPQGEQGEPDQAQIDQAANALVSGEASPDELNEMLKNGEIDQATFDAIMNRAQELSQQAPQEQGQQPEQAPQEQGQQNELDQIAEAIYNKELSADELISQFRENKIDKDSFEYIIQKIAELKEQAPQEQEQQPEQAPQEQEQADQIIQAIISNQLDPNELDQMVQNGEISEEMYNYIIQTLNNLSQQQ